MSPAVDKLLQRQQNILDDLEKLKKEVLDLSKKVGVGEDELNIAGKASMVGTFQKQQKLTSNIISNISLTENFSLYLHSHIWEVTF